jgi:hypothetical protein
MIKIVVIIIFVFIIFLTLDNIINSKEYFCYGNTYCNGNKDNALCINQTCLECGLQSKCTKNEECGPNLCINGCCDLA